MSSLTTFFSSFNPRYIMPFFTALSVVLTSIFTAFIPAEPQGHIFTPPVEADTPTQTFEITDEYVIVVSDTASQAEITAANLLKNTFEQINGTNINIITDSTDKTEKEIALVGNKSGGEEPVLLKSLCPRVKGVMVVCCGAESEKVVKSIKSAVSTLLGINETKVSVVAGNGA